MATTTPLRIVCTDQRPVSVPMTHAHIVAGWVAGEEHPPAAGSADRDSNTDPLLLSEFEVCSFRGV